MNSEIAVIVPDKDLFTLVNEIVGEFSEPIIIEEGYLDDGVDVGYRLENNGIKVLISRGGTTTKLRNSKLQIPVIDIPITEFDIIRVLDQARKISNRIAVIGFDPLVTGSEVIGPILGIEVNTILVQSKTDISKAIKTVFDMGINVIVGARLPVEMAKAYGATGILIKSEKPAVIGAIREAIKLLNAIKRERERGERVHSIFNSIQEGIVSVNAEGILMEFNEIADKVLKLSEGTRAKNQPIDLIMGNGMLNAIKRGEKWIGEIIELNGDKYVCNLNPVVINDQILGATIVFQELQQLQKIEQKVRNNLNQKGFIANHSFRDILHCDIAMERLIDRAKKYAKVDSTIIIEGESGTGKEIFAQSIHNASGRRNGPFVAINCAVLPENLLESELFGYAEGAFTGAKKGGKLGLFELAHNGTLFLDEIEEISLSFQARLLRALEEKRIMRIGDNKLIPINVRIICATNVDLANRVKEGKFRNDFFFRINVLKLNLPPLRNRAQDIPILIDYFLKKLSLSIKDSKSIVLDEETMTFLCGYSYPGNIRELRNIIERMVVATRGENITIDRVKEILDNSQANIDYIPNDQPINTGKKSLVREEEMKLILKVLKKNGGNKAQCARELGISKSTLWRKLNRL